MSSSARLSDESSASILITSSPAVLNPDRMALAVADPSNGTLESCMTYPAGRHEAVLPIHDARLAGMELQALIFSLVRAVISTHTVHHK